MEITCLINVDPDDGRIYRTLVETSPDALILIAPEGMIMLGNSQAASLHGFSSAADIVGQNLFSLIAHEEHGRAMEYLAKTAELGCIRNIEHTLLRVDGSLFPAELSLSVIKDEGGESEAFVVIERDISERKETQTRIGYIMRDLQSLNAELERSYDETLYGWISALDLRDRETEGHSWRVTELTVQLARHMGIPEHDIVHLRRGALLHDIGKMGLPDAVVLKPGPLTEQEWAVMRLHPQYAYDWLSSIEFLRPALDIPYCHHEKWDGSGYPHNLQGEQIPLAARMFAVVDVWDALRSDRPYRPALPESSTRRYIISQSGLHFDPAVVEAFMSMNITAYDKTRITKELHATALA
jgi:PAS domain S-box-containing protein